MFVIFKYILVACLRLFCRGTNMEHVLDKKSIGIDNKLQTP